MTHIALLGDSVIDNKAYVGNAPDVAEQLESLVPKGWTITRLAVDGATTVGVIRQLERLPAGATHVVISAGGNDALGEAGILDASAASVAESLMRLAHVRDRFRDDYKRMTDIVAARKLPTAVCSVYDPRFSDPLRRCIAALALSVINHVITREAFSRRMSLIDLRVMFNDDADFANAIEPPAQGGMKLARAIRHFASEQPQVLI